MNTIRVPQLPAYPPGTAPVAADMVIVYDTTTGITRRASVSDLPFTQGGGGGGGGGTTIYAAGLWKIYNNSLGYVYDPVKGESIISDLRLLGINDGVVHSTQVAGDFRSAQLDFDDAAGTLTIFNFELANNEYISININGAANYAYNAALQSVIKNIADNAALLEPFRDTVTGAGGAKVLWLRPANEIPIGWQECVAMRGLLPLGQDPDDDDFQKAIGTPGGAKSRKLSMDNIPEHIHEQGSESFFNKHGGGIFVGLRNYGQYGSGLPAYTNQSTGTAGKADPNPIDILNPYRIVMWIEYVGV